MKQLLTAVAIGVFFVSCSRTEPIPNPRVVCEESGGIWGRFGLLEIDQCDLAASDAGEACSGHSDCESACVTEDSVAPHTETSGVCFGRTIVLGTCLNYVDGGTAQGGICVD